MPFSFGIRTAAKFLVVLVIVAIGLVATGALPTRTWTVSPPQVQKSSPAYVFSHSESTYNDGVLHYERERDATPAPSLLWLTITHSSQSWGKQRTALLWTTNRTFEDYINLIVTQVDVQTTSVGLLTNSRDEYDNYKSALQNYDFPRVNIFLHPGYDQALQVDRDNRHDKAVQNRRRAELSKLRNYLMLQALKREDHLVWLDADIRYLDPNIVQRMLLHSQERQDMGLLTARCAGKGIDDYDRNSWRGTRSGPRGWDLNPEEIDAGEQERQGQLHVAELYKGTKDDELIELTTVGATILYIRASLIRQGLSFAHQFVVGTRWGKDGWDGIESESLCYQARGLDGGGCAFLGGSWHIRHTND